MARRLGRVAGGAVGRRRRIVLVWVLALLVGASVTVADGAGRARAAPSAPSKSVCPEKPAPGHFTCLSRKRTDTRARSGIEGALPQFVDPVKGYGPSDLQSAYNIPADRGAGATVAVVDAFDDPNAEADLAVYRNQFGLPACGSSDGCFRKVGQTGGAVPTPDTSGWATEAMLDIDMVSAACPLCHILLVEANSDYETDLAVAANWAAGQPGVRAVSNSYGSPESSSDTAYGAAYYAHPNVAMVASAGDTGYGVVFPASSPYVISVGGTSLTAVCGGSTGATCAAGQRPWSEVVWNDLSSAQGATGSGCSTYQPKPAWQHDSCGHRTVADLSAVADLLTGVAVYDTWGSSEDGSPVWNALGGTSAAAPLIAAMIAEANPAHPSASFAYAPANSAGLNDVTTGTNSASACVPGFLCTAGAGYDGPTGQGSPSGLLALGGTGSAPYQLAVAPCAGGNLLTDPGFESAGKGWTASSSTVFGKHTGTGAPHTGKFSVLFQTAGHTYSYKLSQKVGFPASCRSATVSFWLRISTAETTTTAKHDTLVVTLGSAPIGTWSNLQHSRYKKYLHVTVRVALPLDNYNSRSGATLFVTCSENGSKQTSFVIDDASITVS